MIKKWYKKAKAVLAKRWFHKMIKYINKHEDLLLQYVPDRKIRVALDALTDILEGLTK